MEARVRWQLDARLRAVLQRVTAAEACCSARTIGVSSTGTSAAPLRPVTPHVRSSDDVGMLGPWLADPGEGGLRRALIRVAPDVAGLPLRINPRHPQSNPLYWSASAWIDDRFVVKYAWSEVRAQRLRREGTLLKRLRAGPTPLPVPEVVAACDEPALFVMKAVQGTPLSWELASQLAEGELATVSEDLARFLTRLHGLPVGDVLHDLSTVVPTAQADTGRLRRGFPSLVDDRRSTAVLEWCDWVDDVLDRTPAPRDVLVHGDLHGYNQVWDSSTLALQVVVDFEETGAADPHFDFRYLPGNADSLDLVLAVVDSYTRASGTQLRLDRIMAWHTLTLLGDALWRSEAGVALPGGGDAPSWVDDLERRLEALGMG
jgi:aminoglycoside phosphotransferase (APT) family kinase protein